MKARCAHGAPWWREDCPGCTLDDEAEARNAQTHAEYMHAYWAMWRGEATPKQLEVLARAGAENGFKYPQLAERPRPWWGWSDGFAFWCGPCGASLEDGVTHHCPGEPP